jgi:hypothetical protein
LVLCERICGPLSPDGQQQRPVPAGDGLLDHLGVAVDQGLDQGVGGRLVGGVPQLFGVQGAGERDLDLGGRLLSRADGGDPLAGHDVDDRDRGGPRPGEVGEVVPPDAPRFPFQPVRPGAARGRFPRRVSRQDQVFRQQYPLQGGR